MVDCSVPYWWQQPGALQSINLMTVIAAMFVAFCIASTVSFICSIVSKTESPLRKTIWAVLSLGSAAMFAYLLWMTMHIASCL
ncbi:MAG TPA: hypothetical protein VMF58_02315 [Rhizomicrobium sp.]|nr:hypothetical protein [Rhizomicrobium sp.]